MSIKEVAQRLVWVMARAVAVRAVPTTTHAIRKRCGVEGRACWQTFQAQRPGGPTQPSESNPVATSSARDNGLSERLATWSWPRSPYNMFRSSRPSQAGAPTAHRHAITGDERLRPLRRGNPTAMPPTPAQLYVPWHTGWPPMGMRRRAGTRSAGKVCSVTGSPPMTDEAKGLAQAHRACERRCCDPDSR